MKAFLPRYCLFQIAVLSFFTTCCAHVLGHHGVLLRIKVCGSILLNRWLSHIDHINFRLSCFALLAEKSLQSLLIFETSLILDRHGWYSQLSLDCSDRSLSDSRHDIALHKELFNRFDQVLLHLTFVVRHSSRHDKF